MPNRIVKESIRTSKKVNGLSDFQFRLWVYLITYVDDFGRGSADPELIKGLVFPRRKGVTEAQINDAFAKMANIGMVNLYRVDGEPYFCFPNWGDHQRIRNSVARYPSPEDADVCGEPPQVAASCGELPPNPIQSNPIQSESESESESESKENIKENLFEHFWSVYPRSVDKKKTRIAFDKAIKGKDIEAVVSEMLNSIKEWQASGAWDDEQYIPYSATWLNGARWTAKPPQRKDKLPNLERLYREEIERNGQG